MYSNERADIIFFFQYILYLFRLVIYKDSVQLSVVLRLDMIFYNYLLKEKNLHVKQVVDCFKFELEYINHDRFYYCIPTIDKARFFNQSSEVLQPKNIF